MKRHQKIGFLGGTFDPVHRGHLRLAAVAEAVCGLDRIYFVLARHPWHKGARCAPFRDRFAMLALALRGRPRWQPLAIPDPARPTLDPECSPASSYSIDEVRWLQQRHPAATIVYVLGADAFHDLPTWKQYRRLLAACDFAVAPRAGYSLRGLAERLPAALNPRLGRGRIYLGARTVHWLEAFRDSASSTAARAAFSGGGAAPRVPPAVAEYARRAGLYSTDKDQTR